MIAVTVEVMNNDGWKQTIYEEAETVEEACAQAEEFARTKWNDDSFVMNEWKPA